MDTTELENIDKDFEDLQLAENFNVEKEYSELNGYEEKRELLEKTKIVRQTWSILEIYQKIKDNKLVLDPDYQRREIWKNDKKTAFIESLYMEIMIPPIYVVEIPGKDVLEEAKYEVVDGKQRLTAINGFIQGKFTLNDKSLEYYADIFGGKTFGEIKEISPEKTNQVLSSVLDIYVITANSPEFTKYDIFARLNKGAEKLKVNEIRRAIYQSDVTAYITGFIEKRLFDDDENPLKEQYVQLFTKNDIKRFEDYGRFYKTIAFYLQSNTDKCVVEGYNSRPRDMINNVLQELQKGSTKLELNTVQVLMEGTIKLLGALSQNPNKDYIIDSCAPFIVGYMDELLSKIEDIENDSEINSTFEKSPATTSNVNKRLERTVIIMKECIDEDI